MRKTLLVATSALALVAGMSLAAAQVSSPRSEAPKAGEAPKAAEAPKKSERTGQAPKTGEAPKAAETPKKSERTGEAPKKNERTGQAPTTGEAPKSGEAPKKSERTGQAPKAGEAPKGGEAPRAGQTGPNGNATTTTTNERASQVRSVTLSGEQKTRVHEVVIKDRSAHVDRVDFQIRAGVRVPRTFHVFDVPQEVVTVVPQYRGFKYIIVRDELLIIDPDTLEIVAVVQI